MAMSGAGRVATGEEGRRGEEGGGTGEGGGRGRHWDEDEQTTYKESRRKQKGKYKH